MVQQERRAAGLIVSDRIRLRVLVGGELAALEVWSDYLMAQTLAGEFVLSDVLPADREPTGELADGRRVWIDVSAV
jgi:hypothetical protein